MYSKNMFQYYVFCWLLVELLLLWTMLYDEACHLFVTLDYTQRFTRLFTVARTVGSAYTDPWTRYRHLLLRDLFWHQHILNRNVDKRQRGLLNWLLSVTSKKLTARWLPSRRCHLLITVVFTHRDAMGLYVYMGRCFGSRSWYSNYQPDDGTGTKHIRLFYSSSFVLRYCE